MKESEFEHIILENKKKRDDVDQNKLETDHLAKLEKNSTFLGIIGLKNPGRKMIENNIKQLKEHIQVIICTGSKLSVPD